MSETPEILWGALRQYQHNIPNGEFIAGFDHKLVCEIVGKLEAECGEYKQAISGLKQQLAENAEECHSLAMLVKSQDEALAKQEGLVLVPTDPDGIKRLKDVLYPSDWYYPPDMDGFKTDKNAGPRGFVDNFIERLLAAQEQEKEK